MKIKRIIAAVMAVAVVGVNYGTAGYQYGSGSSAFAADTAAAEKEDKVEADGMIFEAVEGGYALRTISRSAKELIVPDEVNGYPVVSISYRFGSTSKCVDIESVKLGKNVRTIERGAFSICKNISVLELNDGLESIGDNAFLTDMLTAPLVLPETVTYVGEGAFFTCHHIPSITVTNPDCVLGEYFAESFLFGYKGSTAEKYAAEKASGVNPYESPNRDFYCREWRFFDIEDKSVPRDVCDKDGIFYIPTEGGYKVYEADEEITELNIPDEVNGYPVVEVADSLCRANRLYERLTSVKLGRNVRRIGYMAFERCDPISITILSADCELGTDSLGKADLYGFKGSTAEAYAEKNGLTFTEIQSVSEKLGDANCDGNVELADAIFIMQVLSNPNRYTITELGRANADVDKSTVGLTANDALFIQEYLLHLRPSLEPET